MKPQKPSKNLAVKVQALQRQINRPYTLAMLGRYGAEQLRMPFSVERNGTPGNKPPSHLFYVKPNRVNHLCIKQPDSEMLLLGHPILSNEWLRAWVRRAQKEAQLWLPDYWDRYAYLTFDHRQLQVGETLRDPGWHVDGLQGDEVPVKKPGDLIFFQCSKPTTQFAPVPPPGGLVCKLNLSTDNVFSFLDAVVTQGMAALLTTVVPDRMHMMGPYTVHRSAPATEAGYKYFLRLVFTHVPVTSTKMTLNHVMSYDYAIHTTTGDVPSHLNLYHPGEL